MSGAARASWILALAAGCCLTLPGRAHDQVPGTAQDRPVLLRGGDLYTVSDGVLPRTDLLFEDGTIRRIGREIEAPAGAMIVDVTGKRVYPGLIAPHTTLGLSEIGAVRATVDHAEVGEITPEVAAHIAYNPDSELIPTVRSHGITTAQVTPVGSLLRGRSFITHLDGWTKEDSMVKPVDGLQVQWYSAAVHVDTGVDDQKLIERKKQIAASRDRLHRAFEDARAYDLARDADLVGAVDLRWEAMRPIFDGEIPVHVRANDYREIVDALDLAESFGLRIVLVGARDSYKLTERLVRQQVPVILGSTTALPLRQDEDYDIAYKLPHLLHEAGVTFCLGHITWGGWAVRNLPFQAGQAVAFGLSQDAALRAITLSTAEILGIDESQGSLEVGKDATLFVSDGDVMDMLGQQVTNMYIKGRRVDLDDRHKQLFRKYRAKPAGDGR